MPIHEEIKPKVHEKFKEFFEGEKGAAKKNALNALFSKDIIPDREMMEKAYEHETVGELAEHLKGMDLEETDAKHLAESFVTRLMNKSFEEEEGADLVELLLKEEGIGGIL